MEERNPYYISFGRIPTKYISRALFTDEIIETLEAEHVEEQAFKITGIRGMGKTVVLTEIERKLRSNGNWIVVDLKANSNFTEDLVAELYSKVPYVASFVDKELNLSKFGIGLSLSKKSPVASINHALREIMKELRTKNKRVLVAIDYEGIPFCLSGAWKVYVG